ncbi:MAG: peptidylprolyl isomerase [Candidatus Obscuribacterales bacterium]|nr:peptidylprolyl isomerase [Candidatus Obscuribacterales bacterium]
MKSRYRLLVSAFALSQVIPLQAVFSQMDPDLVPPEVLVPVPGVQQAPLGSTAPGMAGMGIPGGMPSQAAGIPPQSAGRYPAMQMPSNPAPQGAPGQFSQFQNPYAAALQQQAIGIQPFVPAGWPFDGLPPPGSMPGASAPGFQQVPGMQNGGSPGAFPPGYAQPGLGSTGQQAAYPGNTSPPNAMATSSGVPSASSGNGQVLPNDPAVSTNNADPNTAGPFSSDKECLMCKKKNGEGGTEGDAASSSGASAGTVGAGLASAANPATLPPPAQIMPSGMPAQVQPGAGRPAPVQQDPIVVIQTTKGPITIRLFKQYAPITVANFMDLVQRGFYNGIRWHRVVPGFVIQAGCPKGDGTGGFVDPQSGKPRTVPLELHQRLRHNAPGVVAMARFGNDPNSASSQFYITLAPKQQLDNKYSVFGGVLSGMDTVQKITANDRILGMSLQ